VETGNQHHRAGVATHQVGQAQQQFLCVGRQGIGSDFEVDVLGRAEGLAALRRGGLFGRLRPRPRRGRHRQADHAGHHQRHECGHRGEREVLGVVVGRAHRRVSTVMMLVPVSF